MFPDEKTPDLLFDGVRFADLPIIHAGFSKNNTLLTVTDAKGMQKHISTVLRKGGNELWKTLIPIM